MNIVDWIILSWLIISLLIGFKMGFVYRLGTLVGLIIALIVAGQYYLFIGGFFGGTSLAYISAFTLIAAAISIAAGFALVLVNRVMDIVQWIPFIGGIDRLLGGLLSVVVHAVFLGMVLFLMSRYELHPVLTQSLAESPFATVLLWIGKVASALLPEALRNLKQIY